jgi:hypothetical protein
VERVGKVTAALPPDIRAFGEPFIVIVLRTSRSTFNALAFDRERQVSNPLVHQLALIIS